MSTQPPSFMGQADGDDMYTGFASRIDPANLPQNILQDSYNCRLQRGVAEPRKGTKRLTDSTLNSLVMVGSGQWVDSSGYDNFALIFTDRMYIYRPAQGDVGELLSSAYMFPTGRGIVFGGKVDVVQALTKLYIFRGAATDPILTCTLTNASILNGNTGTLTFITSSSHNCVTGDEVTIQSTSHSAVNGSYIITKIDATTFTVSWTNGTGSTFAANTTATGNTSQKALPPLVWDGTSVSIVPQTSTSGGSANVPPADFGLYFQNRIICNINSQQLAVSDILSDIFDLTLNNFTINQGGNDTIVGVLPWIQDQFLVFMKKSIYLAFVDTSNYATGSSPGANSSITAITTEVGCLARRSIVPAGQFVFFLSGKGVHMLTPQLDLKLLGNTMPLSEPIADVFDDVQYNLIDKAVATYYSNRFYIALPTPTSGDAPVGTTRLTGNNLVLVYNTLNQAWESRDYYPAWGMWIDGLFVSSYSTQRRLFILTNFNGSSNYGGVFLCDEYDNGDQFTGATGTPILPFTLPATISTTAPVLVPINAFIRTREYTFNTLSEKRYSRGEFQFNNSAGDVVSVSVTTHDPDSTDNIISYTFTGSADGTLRPRIAARGTSIDATISFVHGRAALKGTSIYAVMANRGMVTQE